jgi:putative DNA primase/helicase
MAKTLLRDLAALAARWANKSSEVVAAPAMETSPQRFIDMLLSDGIPPHPEYIQADGNPTINERVETPALEPYRNLGAALTNYAGDVPAFLEVRMRDFIHLFMQAIEAAGINPPAEIIPDGSLHRFPTNGKASDTAGWYVLYGGDVPSGAFGCWRSGFQSTWSSKRDREFTSVERHQYSEQIRSAHRQRNAEQLRIQQSSSMGAIGRLSKSRPVVAHPYLKAKNVSPNGITAEGNLLLVPIHDNQGTVHSLQTIDPAGKKRFLAGGKINGHYFAIGVPGKYIVVCEGYATGLTIHACTDMAIAVAFCAGNLTAVAQALQRKYPGVRIIIAADDDWSTPGNPGRAAAKLAALAVGGRVALPIFPTGRPEGATDFNDLHRIAGSDAVVACFADIWER